jgi:tRNA pseudouridine38-40 synthase
LPRYALTLEYDGRAFQGWQIQPHGPSVQAALRDAIAHVDGSAVVPVGAGRTDTGVHASAQIAHADLAKDWRVDRLRDAMNALLRGAPVVVLEARRVSDMFDARRSAILRRYRYVILDRRAPAAIDIGRVWHVPRRLDTEAMGRAARALLGRHDFTTFRNTECQAKSPVRTLDQLDVRREADRVIVETSARSFLHNQVRSMVGSLRAVGDGVKPEGWIADILAARDRARCGLVAPPDGLTLVGVDYPPGAFDTPK